MTRIEITFDEIVIRGMTPGQARVAVVALERRLERIAGDWMRSGSVMADRSEVYRRGPDANVASLTPTGLGYSVAASVWRAAAARNRQ
jgi:hypothetical protein